MTLVTISTIKGAPGGTTLGLLLAQAIGEKWSGPSSALPVLLVECDPCGGDIGPRLDLPGVPGLASLALAARHGFVATAVAQHTQTTACLPGTDLLLGVAGPEQGIALGWMLQPLANMVAELDRWAIADLGRVRPGDDLNDEFRRRAAVNVLVTHDTVASLLHIRAAAESYGLRDLTFHLVVVGERTHPISHIERTTATSVLGVIRFDPGGVTELLSRGGPPAALSWHRPWSWPARWPGSTGLGSDVAGVLKSIQELVEVAGPNRQVARG
jgi:hypothetical protein